MSEDLARYPKIETTTKSNLHRDVVGRLEAALGNDKYFVSHVELDAGYVIGKLLILINCPCDSFGGIKKI